MQGLLKKRTRLSIFLCRTCANNKSLLYNKFSFITFALQTQYPILLWSIFQINHQIWSAKGIHFIIYPELAIIAELLWLFRGMSHKNPFRQAGFVNFIFIFMLSYVLYSMNVGHQSTPSQFACCSFWDGSQEDNFGESLEIFSAVELQTWISFRSNIFKSIGLVYGFLSVNEREGVETFGSWVHTMHRHVQKYGAYCHKYAFKGCLW